MTNKELIDLAIKARENSYSPYSGFRVGAALLADDGRVFCGTNVENASYSLTCCAERTALFSAVASGCTGFAAIAIVGGRDTAPSEFCTPCGACRQALSEFSPNGALKIVLFNGNEEKEFPLSALLPHSFSLDSSCGGGEAPTGL